jgi:RimJ/RimL family protein N-acetyltransferase
VFPVELTGVRVTMREISLDDLDAALAFASDPEVTRYLPFEPQSRQQERAAIVRMTAEARATPRMQFELAAVSRTTGAMVGMGRIGFTPGQTAAADIGYLLRRDCWGSGLGTEIAGLLVGFGFRQLGVHRVWAGHHPDNPASGRVLEKVGMIREGRMREHMFARGVWRDSITYSILEHEWKRPTSH